MTATEAVAAINNDDTLDTTAALIQTAPGEYRIQLSAKNTGADSTVGVDASEFDRLTSGFTTLTTGRDAQISVSGDNPLVITSNTNTFEDVMPGLDITVTEPSTEAVTVTVNEEGFSWSYEGMSQKLADNRIEAFTAFHAMDPDLREELVSTAAGKYRTQGLERRPREQLIAEVEAYLKRLKKEMFRAAANYEDNNQRYIKEEREVVEAMLTRLRAGDPSLSS